jgi:hypothetical protein
MRQIKSSTRYERKDEIEPGHVVPLESSVAAPATALISVTLPHESVSVIRVPIQ